MEKIKRPFFLSVLAFLYVAGFISCLGLVVVFFGPELLELLRNSPRLIPYLIFENEFLALGLGTILINPILFYCVWQPGKWRYRVMVAIYFIGVLTSILEKNPAGVFIPGAILVYLLRSKEVKRWYFQ